MYDLGMVLKELRKKKKLTQEQAANLLNIKRSTLAGYEQNITTPSLHMLPRLAKVYGVTTDYLLGLDKHETIKIDGLTIEQKDIVFKLLQEFRK